ncbi:MAG: hypothetical protein HY231_07890 [Acidobacteria bacterium]|nr:hypothetical protein [Acidobacteriota bacterium]
MTAIELIKNLEAAGVRLEVDGNDLIVDAPEDWLTTERLEALAGHKAAILEILPIRKGALRERRIEEDEAIAWRLEAMKKQMPAKPPYPLLVAREGVKTTKGECYLCGDALTGDSLRAMNWTPRVRITVGFDFITP